ncbi:hypothetical protein B481_1354 [Planococcus halocryophilus Or1]|uniref:Uncharacterized protein n=1 Tax=Planococcus halocryophilus TaxID=1215089 RepID=A0A1C7DVC6_9BACL|nr:hypothetical protein [Planococcus halocryophilus]ANU15231.1 hypothetical protein BBI08_15825 [Planococcus halocryophilus]EMF46967.1 hypothetical protein B481_1354 [Planococcus halocryophilus Or1]
MLTKDSIERVMRERNRKGDNLIRDIQIVQSYFGLGIQKTFTYQSLADEFGGMTRERIRQIINNKFIKKVEEMDKGSLYEIQSVVSEFPVILLEDLKDILEQRGLADNGLHNQGLYNLLEVFEICSEYEVCTLDFDIPTRFDFENSASVFMVQRKAKDTLYKALQNIREVLGMHGIVCLEKIFEQENLDKRNILFFRSLLSHSRDCWTYESKEGLWYLWENRDSVLFNVLEKVAFVTKKIPIENLSDVIHRYINRRTLLYGAPNQAIISKYLKEGKKTIYNNDEVTLLIDGKVLNDIEQSILRFYREREEVNIPYSELSVYLQELDYQKPYYDIALFRSPILFVERSDGRGNYRFIIIDALASMSLYEKTKKRLGKLEGTNISVEVQMRKEQAILREWLFLGKNSEYCAICGELYSISSMVCAHKKKRANCTEDERTDPYIVMPLCLFGCDIMYEHEYFEIVEGKVVSHLEDLMETEKKYVKAIQGRAIDFRWLKGNADYFKREYLPGMRNSTKRF